MSRGVRLSDAARWLLDPGQPAWAIIYATGRCNFRCPFCFYADALTRTARAEELTVAEHERVARSVGPLLQLSFGGGEPFLREELPQIAQAWLNHTRAPYLSVTTNGWFTDAIVHFLEALLPRYPRSTFRLILSVEAIGGAHDEIRGKADSWRHIERSYRALEALRRRHGNLVLDTNSVFTAATQDSLLGTLRYLDAHFDFDNLSVTYARGSLPEPSLAPTSLDRYLEIHRFVQERPRRSEGRRLSSLVRAVDDLSRHALVRTLRNQVPFSPCVAGRKLIVLREDGEVRLCELLEASLGNVRAHGHDLPALLATPLAERARAGVAAERCRCSWECALAAGVVFDRRRYASLALRTVRNLVGTVSPRSGASDGAPAVPLSPRRRHSRLD